MVIPNWIHLLIENPVGYSFNFIKCILWQNGEYQSEKHHQFSMIDNWKADCISPNITLIFGFSNDGYVSFTIILYQ